MAHAVPPVGVSCGHVRGQIAEVQSRMHTFLRRARSLALKATWATASKLRVCWFRLQNEGATIPWSTTIGAGVRIRVTDGGLLHLAGHVTLERNVLICAQGGRIEIGAHSFIGMGVTIIAKGGISIGADALIAE